MSFFERTAMRYLDKYIEPHLEVFSDLKKDLKRSGMRKTLEEYLSTSLLMCIILFVIELPIFSLIFSLLNLGFLFSFFMAITTSVLVCSFFFLMFVNYPKFLIRDKARSIDKTLPFAGIYLSTIASSRLPPHRIFEIFSKFKEYGEVSYEAKRIVADMKMFGLNVYDSLEKAVERTPSKDLRDLFWTILSTLKAGGDLHAYLDEKSKSFLSDYRRRLDEFSQSLSIYLEIYLTALVLGTIFFIILTSVMSVFSVMLAENIIFVLFFLIFLFVQLISTSFIILIKAASPGGE
ncbi:MAG: type II secretion system F family protein [Candidatus Aenigmarchaeota archaeon]|nr:type II secretion system F family protein [Candidatus Aenigmarchaeota archaeon]